MDPIIPHLSTEAIAALQAGSKIEAIKQVRVQQGVGLKEAKEIVELYIDQNPLIKEQMALANKSSAKGCLSWVLLLAALAGAIKFWLFKD